MANVPFRLKKKKKKRFCYQGKIFEVLFCLNCCNERSSQSSQEANRRNRLQNKLEFHLQSSVRLSNYFNHKYFFAWNNKNIFEQNFIKCVLPQASSRQNWTWLKSAKLNVNLLNCFLKCFKKLETRTAALSNFNLFEQNWTLYLLIF